MLNADLVVTDSGTATKPGVLGAKTFALVASLINGSSKRRIAATATSTPQEMTCGHQTSGAGVAARCRTVVRFDLTRNDVDPSLYGGKPPTASAYMVIDRPLNQGAAIATADIKNLVGQLVDAILATGQLDKLLNQES